MSPVETQRLKQLLGLAQAAGKAVSATPEVESSISRNKVRLLILAEDATERVRKKYQQEADINEVTLITALTRNDIGQALGKSPRGIAAVLDNGFKKSVLKIVAPELLKKNTGVD